jgi:hypothetical protein
MNEESKVKWKIIDEDDGSQTLRFYFDPELETSSEMGKAVMEALKDFYLTINIPDEEEENETPT